MGQWIAVGDGFIEADVIRWQEGVFDRRGPRGARAISIGDRLVIAEVLSEAEEGWVYLLVRSCEVIKEKSSKKVEKLQVGKDIKRKRSTIARGKPVRLLWSDEEARAVLASQFLGNRKPVSSVSKKKTDTRES